MTMVVAVVVVAAEGAAADKLTIDPTKKLEKENQDLKTVQAEEIAQLNARLELQEKFAIEYFETVKYLQDYIVRNKSRLT
jgi:ABC-type metal ion transport system substrate-binding protein